jgi:hypothetical protein
MISNEKLRLLAEHHRDSVNDLRAGISRRDRLFLVVVALLAGMLFLTHAPTQGFSTINQFIQNKTGITTAFESETLGTLLWFLLLGTVLKYFQTVAYVEGQYDYIGLLEKKLSLNLPLPFYSREGEHYAANERGIQTWAWFIYSGAFPVILGLVGGWKILSESLANVHYNGTTVMDTFFFAAICISIFLHLRSTHRKK